MRLSSPRILIAGASVVALAAAGGVAVAATGDTPSKPAAKTGAAAQADPNALVESFTPKTSDAAIKATTPARVAASKPLKMPTINAAPASEAQASALSSGPVFEGAPTEPTVKDKASASAQGMASTQAVVEARVWTRHRSAPAKMIGKLLFDTPQGKNAHCSATVITAKNKRTVWTAGHCVNSGGKNGRRGRDYWNFRFIPDLPAKHTVWRIDRVVTLQGWTKHSNPAYDIAAVTTRGKIQNYTGSQGYSFGYKKRAYRMWSFGYPANRIPGFKRYANNNLLRYCNGNTFGIRYRNASGVHLGMKCTMGQGASGGPWIYAPNRKGYGRIAGINSMHANRTKDMYSPYHGSAAVAVYKAASK
ncbi:trypsin-like serine peptidase [Actinomadura rudentiformis]|uniref:Trypsin-like serine protease n=1 Tax=Actinomadura rudentiformis TaxID=359158 RepID=A0A6H9YJ71_9ACTN|nr:trypsin-like serine protease [Actinomadura rudentiformis]KAB2341307.1 trypsin-like serine protease [Actinomadura rudentiformis]